MNRITSLPLEKIKNLLSEKYASDTKYSDFSKIIDLLDDRKALSGYIPQKNGFYDRTFDRSDLYDAENFFTVAFGEGFEINSYRQFPNPFYLKVESKTGVPIFTGQSLGFITPIEKVSLNDYLQLSQDVAPSYYETISVNRDVNYGTLGAYYYQIASIMMAQSQVTTYWHYAACGTGPLSMQDYSELKVIPTFAALWGLYGYCRHCASIVPNKAFQDKQSKRFYAYEVWAHGIIMDVLTQLAESPNPDTVVEILLSVIRGIKLFELHLRYSVLESEGDRIEKDVKAVFSAEKSVSSILRKYGIDSFNSIMLI